MKKVLSLGAGVQSTTVLLMSCLGELETLDLAIFADTGWEPKAVYKHLDWLERFSTDHGIPVERVSCGRNIKEDALVATMRGLKKNGERFVNIPFYTLGPDGGRGMVRRQCTREFKIDPINKRLRAIIQPPRCKPKPPLPMVEQWFGISSDEKQRMRLSDKWWATNHYPLVEMYMDRGGCYQWLYKHGFRVPARSACIACPYKSNAEWRYLREASPEEFAEAVEFDATIRKRGGMRGDLFVHRECIPLGEVDLSTQEDHGQMNLWREECAGMCGV